MHQKLPCTLRPVCPVAASCITRVQYQNQEIDSDTILLRFRQFYMYSFAGVCVMLRAYILRCVSGFVLHVTAFLPSLFMGFAWAPGCGACSLLQFLRRIPQCTFPTYKVPVSQQWAASCFPPPQTILRRISSPSPLVDLDRSDVQAGLGLLGRSSAWL